MCLWCAGAEHTTAKGSARAADHNRMVHEIWTLALVHGIHLWIERVPTEVFPSSLRRSARLVPLMRCV